MDRRLGKLIGTTRGRLCLLAVAYLLYVIYVVVNYLIIPNGLKDPVYRLAGLPRTEQAFAVTFTFGLFAALILLRALSRLDRRMDFSGDPAVRRQVLLLAGLVLLNAACASIGAVVADVNPRFWPLLAVWMGLVTVAQGAVLCGLLWWSRSPRLHLAALAGMSLLNVYAVHLALIESFQRLSEPTQILVLIVIGLGFVLLYGAVGKRALSLRPTNGVLALTAIAPLAALLLRMEPSQTDLEAFNSVELRRTPNIHIVSMDALSPPTVIRKYLGLENLPYEGPLAADGVITFSNAFSSQAPTKPSLNSVMRLAHPGYARRYTYFSGRDNGPLASLLHANGYKVITGFENLYLGNRGPFIDAYLPEPSLDLVHSTLCALAPNDPLTLFGYCRLAELVLPPQSARPWNQRVLELIEQLGSASDQPVFTFQHLLSPIGHTSSDFRFSDPKARADYKDIYLRRSATVAELMERLSAVVRNDRRPSFLFVMGDHGTYFSRTVPYEDDRTFVVQDQHGILATVLVNETGCSAEELRRYAHRYATPSRVLVGLFRCLAKQPAAVDAAAEFDEAYPFSEYLYE